MKGLSRPLSCVCGILLLALTSCSSTAGKAPTPTPVATATSIPLQPVPHKSAFTATLVSDLNGLQDNSFNTMALNGLKRSKKQYGIKFVAENSHAVADYLPKLVQSAQRYSAITIAIGYSMARATYSAARQFPGARFVIIDGRPIDPNGHEVILPNVENLLFKEQESGYLAGALAGLMEKNHVGKAVHNTIGYLGGQPIPAVDRYLAGYVAGAQKVDPKIKILGDYSRSFIDVQIGKSIGEKQIGQGADILFQVAADTGRGYLSAAEKHGVYGIGVDSNQRYLGTEVISSAMKHVNSAVQVAVSNALRGKFRSGDVLVGATTGATGIAAPSKVVPPFIAAQVRALKKKIASGAIIPPTTIPAH